MSSSPSCLKAYLWQKGNDKGRGGAVRGRRRCLGSCKREGEVLEELLECSLCKLSDRGRSTGPDLPPIFLAPSRYLHGFLHGARTSYSLFLSRIRRYGRYTCSQEMRWAFDHSLLCRNSHKTFHHPKKHPRKPIIVVLYSVTYSDLRKYLHWRRKDNKKMFNLDQMCKDYINICWKCNGKTIDTHGSICWYILSLLVAVKHLIIRVILIFTLFTNHLWACSQVVPLAMLFS